MFKIIFPATLILAVATWYSPYGWGTTYGPHPERNLMISGFLYTVVFFLILGELLAWRKKGVPRGWPVAAIYATCSLCQAALGGFSFITQFTSVHGQEAFHRFALLWTFAMILLLGIGHLLRKKFAGVADATR